MYAYGNQISARKRNKNRTPLKDRTTRPIFLREQLISSFIN